MTTTDSRKASSASVGVPAIEARAMAGIYSFLAGVFSCHPSRESAHALMRLAAGLGITCPEHISLDDLDREYMDLFVIPNSRYVAPYESVFRDHWPLPPFLVPGGNPAETGRTIKGLVMGESTLRVRRCYLEAGVAMEQELPDHIGNELRFMAYLWGREAESPDFEDGRLARLRAKFRQEHLRHWIAQLREKVAEVDRVGYYHAATKVAEAVLNNDE